jgi:CHAD domain-containing protein
VTFLGNGVRGLPIKRKAKALKKGVKIDWDPHKRVAANASEKLPDFARAFLAAGAGLGDAEVSFKGLHRFRLLTKRFRYTLEMFRPCYGPGLEERIQALQILQQHLGDINDCAATEALVLERKDLAEEERERLLGRLKSLSGTRIAGLHQYWQEEFASERKQKWWIDYLGRFARE